MKNLKLRSYEHALAEGCNFCSDFGDTICYPPSSLVKSEDASVIGLEYLPETDNIFVALSSGDIVLFEPNQDKATNVGTVDSGIEGFAWSPDNEFLVLLTGTNTLILMTKDFDCITEKSICPDEFGESKPITVGWGSKETQFHGSEGKEAAKIKKIEPKPALTYDDQRPRISWRGDGEYFVISSIHSIGGYRHLRIWSRAAVLQFTGEIKEGLEEPICWKPSGNVIACSQQDSNKHKIIFFEKNGLQHGEFALPLKPNSHKVTNLLWNADSTVLLVVVQPIEKPSYFQVMLWTCGNYHWYLKQSFTLHSLDYEHSLITKWSQISPYKLFCLNQTTQEFHIIEWAWTVSSSPSLCDDDDAIVVSIDNDSILVTPFATMVVPPPLCAYSYTLPSTVQSVCFAPNSSRFCCYLGNFSLAFFRKGPQEEIKNSDDCKIKLIAAGGNGFKSKVQPYIFEGIMRVSTTGIETPELGLYHWTWVQSDVLLCVCSVKQAETVKFELMSFKISTECQSEAKVIYSFDHDVVGMCSNMLGNVLAVQLVNGNILKLNIDNYIKNLDAPLVPWVCADGKILCVQRRCLNMSIIHINGKDYFLCLEECYLKLNNDAILTNCTSYYIHDEYLLATTTDHVLKCFLIDYDLADLKNSQSSSEIQFQKIEKGAKIVIAPSKTTKVILQMPRGNLETIHPRPLVLSCVCKHLDNFQFDQAFSLSKIHRIDLNILYDHNPQEFLRNVILFVEQLNSETNINLFLASLREEDVCETLYSLSYKGKNRPTKLETENCKVDSICNAIRKVIEYKNDERLFLALIATYAKKSEPELEQALLLLKNMKDSNSESSQQLVDSALNFLIYLVDVNDLIDVAVGTYDLEIAVMVSQKSQKDPKEFLPFYNELQQMEENYRKYKIDIHLEKFKSALQHISKCEDNFDECLSLIKKQRLYVDALYLFPPLSDKYKVVWKEYGTYLMGKRYYDEAGLAFTRCEDYEKALLAYKESLNWQCMLCAAMQLSYSDDQIISLCIEVAEKLKSNQKYLEASYLMEQYVKDIEECIVTLIEGCEWNSALHLMAKYRRKDISETHLTPALKEHYVYLNSHLDQLSTDFKTHVDRLKVVRLQKQKNVEVHDVVKHADEELFSETGSVTDVASSVAESKLSGSIMTRKSSKSRRKQKLKKYRVTEGSPDEDFALMSLLSEIVVKIDSLKDNFLNTLEVLVQFGFDNEARTLQHKMCNLISFVESQMPDIWKPLETDPLKNEMKFGPDSTSNSISALLLSEKANQGARTDPDLAQPPWRKLDCYLQMFK